MTRTLIVATLMALTLLAAAPVAEAAAPETDSAAPCTHSITPTGGYVACCDVHLWVNYGSATYRC